MKLDLKSLKAAKLSETRKKDREVMAGELDALCLKHGVPSRFIREFLGCPSAIAVEINGPHGLSATIDFSGESVQPNIYVVSWHFRFLMTEGDHVIAPGFAPDINPHHKRKATDVCRGFPDLMARMEIRLASMVAGTATQLPRQYER